MRKVAFALSVWLLIPNVLLATWAEPTCDPATDPTSCNISAPINVSTSNQTKYGSLTIGSGGTLTADGVLDVNGAATFDGLVTVNGTEMMINALLLVNNGLSVGTTGSSIFKNGVTLDTTSSFTYSGTNTNFSLTADSIDDGEVSNTLTASIFQGGGSTNAVDLDSSEVAGTLLSTSVSDVWVNDTGDTMNGTLTINPTTGRAIAIQPNTTSDGIWISGATEEALVSLNQTGNGRGIYLNTIVGVTGKGIEVVYAGSDYSVHIDSTGPSTRSLNVKNRATGGYGVYSTAGGTNGIGVAGISKTGTGGFFITDAVGGTGLYATLNSTNTTTSSKALEVVGKNGYGAYITADGDSSTGLYVENTNTNYGTTKYGIQAIATTPQGEGIYAVSDYGRAGHFESNSGGTAVYIDATGATYGIDLNASGTTAGIDITVDDGEVALDANNGEIKAEGGFRGGQFYPAAGTAQAITPNIYPDLIETITIGAGGGILYTNGLLYDGSDIWTASFQHGSIANSVAVQRINGYNGYKTAEYNSTWMIGYAPGAMVYANNAIYAFSSSSVTDEYLRMYLFSDSATSGTLSTAVSARSAVYDGSNIWLGTTDRIYTSTSSGTLTSIKSGIGEIVDMIFANGYIWALDQDNEVVYQIKSASGITVNTITVGSSPVDMEFDGANLWVSNGGTGTLTRILVSDGSTETINQSPTWSDVGPLAFDGVNLWVMDGDTLYAYNIASATVSDGTLTLGDSSYNDMIFDGSFLWIAKDTEVNKVGVGRGHGYAMPTYPGGIMLYGADDQYHCIYFDSSGNMQDSISLTQCL